MLCLNLEWEFLGASIGIQTRHGSSVDAAVQVLNALAPCQQEQGDLSGAEAMLRSSVILAKHQQDLTSQVTSCQHPLCIIILSFHYMKIPTAVTPGPYFDALWALWGPLPSIGRARVSSSSLLCQAIGCQGVGSAGSCCIVAGGKHVGHEAVHAVLANMQP